MAPDERETRPFWRTAWPPPAVGLLCVLAGWLVGTLRDDPPPNCDFSCAMAGIGWQDYLVMLLFGLGAVAFFVFILVCLVLWAGMAVSALRGLRR